VSRYFLTIIGALFADYPGSVRRGCFAPLERRWRQRL